jgi:carotenoid cleavage dioxygenase-like enzyme
VSKALGEERVEGPRNAFDTVNTNVVRFARRTLGLVEAGSTPVEIGETLETLRYTDFGGTLHGSFTAHPHVDPLTGEMHGICYDVSRRNAIRYVVVTPEGSVRREVKIPIKHGPMIHDCAFTLSFAIILDLSLSRCCPAYRAIRFRIAGGHHIWRVWDCCREKGRRKTSSGSRSSPATSFTP